MNASAGSVSRSPWSTRRVALAGLALETSVLLGVVGMISAGAFDGGVEESIELPIRLGLRDVPALVVLAFFVLLRERWANVAGLLARAPPFVFFCALITAAAASAHPDPALGAPLSAAAGLLVGVIFGVFGMPMHAFAQALADREAQPWRELHVASALVVLGSLGAAVRGGALVSAPTIGGGLVLLLRGLHQDGSHLLSASGGRASAALRLLLGGAFFLLGLGLLVVSTAISFGLARVAG